MPSSDRWAPEPGSPDPTAPRAPGPRRAAPWAAWGATLAGWVLAVCVLTPPDAHAQTTPGPTPGQDQTSGGADLTLVADWRAPASCPSGIVLTAEVERILGRAPTGGPFATITVSARGARHSAVLELTGGGRRRIDAGSCDALLRAVALVLALHIDPDALSLDAPEPEEPLPAPEPPPIPELEGAVDLARALAPDPARALGSPFPPGQSREPREPDARFLGGAGLVLDLGAMPDLAPGVWLGALARLGWFEVGIEGRFLPEQRARLAPRPQVGADITMLAGRVRIGAAIVMARIDVVTLELAPVAALELGSVSGRAVGLTTPLAGASLWWALDLGLEARVFILDAIGLFMRGEVEVALRRSSFLIEGYTTPVFRAADAGFVGVIGVLLRTS